MRYPTWRKRPKNPLLHLDEPLGVNDQIVPRCVKVRDTGGRLVAPCLIEAAGIGVVGSSCGLNHDEPGSSDKPPFHLGEQRTSYPDMLTGWIDRHPVEVVRTQRAGRGSPANPANETALDIRAEGRVVRFASLGRSSTGYRGIEHLQCHRQLIRTKDADRPSNCFDSVAVGGGEAPEFQPDERVGQAAGTPRTRSAAKRLGCIRVSASSTI